MYTVSNILQDVDRGILSHNMAENMFSYRVVYFINFENKSEKHYIDTRYDSLRITLENIIRGNLTTTNSIVILQTTTIKDGKCVYLQSRAYGFSLDEYFHQIVGEREKDNVNSNYRRRRANWC